MCIVCMYIFVLVIYLFIDIGNDLYICLFAFVLYLCTYTYLYLLQHKTKTIQDISLLSFLYVLIYTPFFLLAELWPVFVPHPLRENVAMPVPVCGARGATPYSSRSGNFYRIADTDQLPLLIIISY